MFYRVKQAIPAVVLVCATVLGGGCTKENDAERQFSVKFNVASLGVDVEEMTKAATSSGAAIGDVVNTIGYVITTDAGSYITSNSSSFNPATETAPEDFGTFSAVLSAGGYYIRLYAYGAGSGSIAMTNQAQQFEGYDKDFFFLGKSFTVSSDETTVSLSVPRESAMLRIKINDKVPSSVSKVTVSLSTKEKRAGGSAADDMTKGRTYEMTITGDVLSTKDIYIPFASRNSKADVTIKVFENSSETASYSIPVSVNFYANRRTVISGNLFDALNGKDLVITIQDSWGTDVNVPLE